MSFDAYAVVTRRGPHVTMQAGVVHLGRYWTTTTRRSLKVAAVRRHGWAAALLAGPGGPRLVAGPARVLDPARPWSALAAGPQAAATAAVDGALAGGALARLAGAHLEQVRGYLDAGRAVPSAFLPWGRVLLVTDLAHDMAVPGAAVPGEAAVPHEARRPPPFPGDVPPAVAALAVRAGPCHVGVRALGGAAALPGSWDPVGGVALVAWRALAAVGAELPGPGCTTLDESTSRRPDRKLGLLLRGPVTAEDAGAGMAALRIAPRHTSWWEGFRSGTALAGR